MLFLKKYNYILYYIKIEIIYELIYFIFLNTSIKINTPLKILGS